MTTFLVLGRSDNLRFDPDECSFWQDILRIEPIGDNTIACKLMELILYEGVKKDHDFAIFE